MPEDGFHLKGMTWSGPLLHAPHQGLHARLPKQGFALHGGSGEELALEIPRS